MVLYIRKSIRIFAAWNKNKKQLKTLLILL